MKISLIVSADITDSYGFNVLAAQLKKFKDRNVEVGQFYIFYDFNKSYPPEAIEDLVSLCRGSDLIGISLLSSAFKNSVAITKALKEKINCPVIWGGKHPTADPEECVRYADMICLSEGEDALCELVERMLENKSYDDIQNLWVRKGDWIIKNPLRPVEENLDRFLPPDYSLENKFVLDKKTLRIRPIEDRDLENMRLWYPTMMTRGCPNCCTFCTNSTDLRLRKMRSRGLDNVFGEIKIFLKKYPDTKRIFFRDDCISAMPLDFIKEFCRRWKEEINLPCSCSGVIATSPDFEEKIKLQQEIEKTKIMISNKKESVFNNLRMIKNLEEQINELQNLKFDEIRIYEIEKEILSVKEERAKFNEKSLEVNSQINSLNLMNDELRKLEKKISNLEICPTCLQNVEPFYRANILNKTHSDIAENERKLEIFEQQKKQISERIKKIDLEMYSKEKKLTELKILKIKIQEINEKQRQLKSIGDSNKMLEKDIEILNQHTISLNKSIILVPSPKTASAST